MFLYYRLISFYIGWLWPCQGKITNEAKLAFGFLGLDVLLFRFQRWNCTKVATVKRIAPLFRCELACFTESGRMPVAEAGQQMREFKNNRQRFPTSRMGILEECESGRREV